MSSSAALPSPPSSSLAWCTVAPSLPGFQYWRHRIWIRYQTTEPVCSHYQRCTAYRVEYWWLLGSWSNRWKPLVWAGTSKLQGQCRSRSLVLCDDRSNWRGSRLGCTETSSLRLSALGGFVWYGSEGPSSLVDLTHQPIWTILSLKCLDTSWGCFSLGGCLLKMS